MASQKVQGLNIKLSADASAVGQALKDIDKSLSSTQKELRQVNDLLKLDPTNTTLLTQKQGLLSDAIDKTKQRLEALNKAKELADSDDSVDKNTKEYRELERQIEATTKKLNNFEQQNETNNKILDVSSNKVSYFAETLKANLTSEAIIGGLSILGQVLEDVGKKALALVKDGASYADDINALSAQYNLSTKEIQQYMKASDLIDVEFNTIAKSLSKLTKVMNNPSTSVNEAFKKLGISVKDSKGELRDSNEVFNEVIEALSKVSNETEQDALALEIFGKSSAELGSLINGGAEQLKEFNKYLEENNLLLSQEELDSLNAVQDGFDTFNATIDGIKKKIGAELAPILQPLVEKINQFIIDHKDDIIEIVDSIANWVQSEEGQKFFQDVKDMGSDIAQMLKDIIDLGEETGLWDDALKIVKATITVVSDLVSGIKKMVEQIIDMLNGDYDWLEAKDTMGNPYRRMGYHNSGGFGALQSGGYGNSITLNASFVANGNLSEAQARRFADLMANEINERLGGEI